MFFLDLEVFVKLQDCCRGSWTKNFPGCIAVTQTKDQQTNKQKAGNHTNAVEQNYLDVKETIGGTNVVIITR